MKSARCRTLLKENDMGKDRVFGNIDLNLWQVSGHIDKMILHDKQLPYYHISEEEYVRIAHSMMLDFLLKRLSRRGERQMVTFDSLCMALSDCNMEYQATSASWTYKMISEVRFSGITVQFTEQGDRTHIRVCLPFSSEFSYTPHFSKCCVTGEEFLACLMMIKSLRDRISTMVSEVYNARLAKARSNRIRRIAAKARRRMQ